MLKLPSNRMPSAPRRGMTLIEILVAIVVLSVGLLGLAGLQLKGLQVNQGSVYRWQAAMLAEDIADRIRADRAGALKGAYTVNGGAPSSLATGGTLVAVNDWLARVQALPQAKVLIVDPTPAAPNTVSITISWVDTRANAGVGAPTSTAPGYVPGTYTLTTEF
jgi:type IV pilus assembly protein PilV